jgi:hypothetical protein
MGLFAGLPLLGGALGGAFGGYLNDLLIRVTGRRRWSRSGVAATGKFLAGVLVFASVNVDDGRWVMAVLLACKFFGDWSLSTVWGTITDISGPASGTVFGVLNTVGSLAGFAAGPLLGDLKQSHGWDGPFYVVGGLFVLCSVCWLFIDCTRSLVVEAGPESS